MKKYRYYKAYLYRLVYVKKSQTNKKVKLAK